jgi:energy-coupling factor transporter ATP-binding protein EcfA2
MRLKKMSVQGLFGLFDHEIPFNQDGRITILHAPNGYGKTAILKLVAGFFGGSLAVLRQFEFRTLTFELIDGAVVRIVQRDTQVKDRPLARADRYYSISLLHGDETKEFDPLAQRLGPGEKVTRNQFPSHLLERHVPFLQRTGPGSFMDVRNKRLYSYAEALEEFWGYLPESARSKRAHPEWLDELRKAVHCRLIETQRLTTVRMRDPEEFEDDEPTLIPVVQTISDKLVERIEQALAESGTLSQSLDRTFPNRLLRTISPTLPEDEVRRRLLALEQKRAQLTDAGLLEKTVESALIPGETLDNSTLRILSEYIKDAEQKLDVYNFLFVRIELLTRIINNRFQFKKLAIRRHEGFVFTDVVGRRVPLDSLSSGEQHELVLTNDLLFETKENTLLLIDEPEISLHIAWQRNFIPDLKQIIQLAPMDVLISTHSPQLIGSYIDLAVQLRGPKDVEGS